MNVMLLVITGLLATVALVGGATKAFVPKEKLAAHSGGEWVEAADDGFVKTLGVLELLAALGLVLPAVLNIAPVMVPVTALCWVLLMIGAMITHARLANSSSSWSTRSTSRSRSSSRGADSDRGPTYERASDERGNREPSRSSQPALHRRLRDARIGG